MLRREQNDLLTQTGPATPMGEMFRRYWIPALLATELPENDCPPVRVKLLSERLLAVRDSEGRYGLIDEFCAHRGVSLWFGRNEECGIRCPYHGWKYDVFGNCLDVPSEPEESGFRQRIKLKAYPMVERGGILWTYMGPEDAKPALPEWDFITVPPEQTFSSKRIQESNWLQAMEGGIDSAHVSFLHRGQPQQRPVVQGLARQPVQPERQPAVLRGGGAPVRPVHRRAAAGGGRAVLLADHALGDAVLHHGSAARRPPDARAFLDPDRRRELLGLELRLPPGACADGDGGAAHARRARGAQRVRARHLPAAGEQGQRLPDGPRGAEGGHHLQRGEGDRDPGRVVAGKHGPDRGPHEGEPDHHRQRHHHGAHPPDAGGQGAGR